MTALVVALTLIAVPAPLVHAEPKVSICADTPMKAVKACIWQAAKKYHVRYGLALCMADKESGLDPKEIYLNQWGLYRFIPLTWNTTPYAKHSKLSAKYNALAAMYHLKHSDPYHEWPNTYAPCL